MKLATKALSHLLLSFWGFANAADTTPSPVFFFSVFACISHPGKDSTSSFRND